MQKRELARRALAPLQLPAAEPAMAIKDAVAPEQSAWVPAWEV
jgi:hypothetical protein